VTVLATRLLPRWIGWFGVVAAIAALASLVFVTMFVWLLWIAVTSIVLFLAIRKDSGFTKESPLASAS
jgi:hypothetical protein